MTLDPTAKQSSQDDQPVILKPTALLAISIVILCAIALAYVGGVMSGRASAEEDYYAEIAARNAVQIDTQNEQKQAPGILSAEELEFSRVLRNSNELPSSKAVKPIPPPPQPKKATPPEPKPGTEVPLITNPDPGIYDYTYQVAAVKGEDNADALRQRLEGRGLRTYMKQSGKFLLIQVKLRGTSARSDELLRILDSLRLGRPILVSQKPARN